MDPVNTPDFTCAIARFSTQATAVDACRSALAALQREKLEYYLGSKPFNEPRLTSIKAEEGDIARTEAAALESLIRDAGALFAWLSLEEGEEGACRLLAETVQASLDAEQARNRYWKVDGTEGLPDWRRSKARKAYAAAMDVAEERLSETLASIARTLAKAPEHDGPVSAADARGLLSADDMRSAEPELAIA